MHNNQGLIKAMHRPDFYPHPVDNIRLVETHISLVFLTGKFVYKIKKPLDLGFLDFSTLEKRHLCCKEELRLNRRLAPDIYLAVVRISKDTGGYHLHENDNSTQTTCEYAVKMRQFDPQQQFDLLLEQGRLQFRHIDQLADCVAAFHARVAQAAAETDYGSPQRIQEPVMENFAQIRQHLPDDLQTEHSARLNRLETCSRQKCGELYAVFEQRKQKGFIRECHGDMHLRNIALDNKSNTDKEQIIIFDCIEFNPNLRWIDVISELAFTIMDLDARGHADFGWRLLNRYLEITGDYAGLQLLRFYCCYRAMVRAKVAAIETEQTHETEQIHNTRNDTDKHRAELNHYLQLAEHYSHARSPALIISHGFSGSGKSTLARSLLQQAGAIRIRSDVERLRLFADKNKQDKDAVGQGAYTKDISTRVYQHLRDIAQSLLVQGYKVIVDATFLRESHRTLFSALANELDVPFVILSLTADEATLKQRIQQRETQADDISEATLNVLEHQFAHHDTLSEKELGRTILCNSEKDVDIDTLLQSLNQHGIT